MPELSDIARVFEGAMINLGWDDAMGCVVPNACGRVLQRWAEQRDDTGTIARLYLAMLEHEGKGGMPRRDTTGVVAACEDWLFAGVGQGSPTAHFFMGWRFEHGVGVAQSRETALEHYKRAADNGHLLAQHWLAILMADWEDM